jgi:hypothetical protein
LEAVAEQSTSPSRRLRRWLDLLVTSKQSRARDDPELFATYVQIAGESREVIAAHVETLVGQLARIISDGVEQGEFVAKDPKATARAVFDATARFHNPANSSSWSDPRISAAYEQVKRLVLSGLEAGDRRSKPGGSL